MNVQVENLEKSMAKLTVTVPAADFNKAIDRSFQKNKGRFNVPGFRKGKAPQSMVEKMYGVGALLEDAVDAAIDASYPEAARESGLDIVSRPQINLEKVNKDEDFVYTVEVAVRPDVVLGEYKGVEVQRAEEEVTQEDLDSALKSEQERNSRLITVEDRPAEIGDNVTLDFEGSIDGVAFDGGKGEDYPLELGSGTFIPGFEDQIAGHNAGDSFDVKVSFPEDYQMKDLAGKEAVFACTLKEVKRKELPEIDDDFASEISEFETLEEYKEDLKKKLKEAKSKRAVTLNENAIVDKVANAAQIEIPDPMAEAQIDGLMADYARRMESQGITLDQYLQLTGMTREQVREQFKPQAISQIRTRLVLEEIAKAENIEVSQEDLDAELTKMAESYKMELEKLKEVLGENEKNQFKLDLAVQKAVDFLVEHANLV